ncbi:MAG: hypothetical protein R3A44_29480 [Caldilineaceae bacterium]
MLARLVRALLTRLVYRVFLVLCVTLCLFLFYILLTAVQIYARTDRDPCAYESFCLPAAHEGLRWRVIRPNTMDAVGAEPAKESHEMQDYPYYWVAGYGLTDMSHLRPSHNRMEEILAEMKSGAVVLEFELGHSYVTNMQRKIWGLYRVPKDLTEMESKRVALAIALDFVTNIEAQQSPGSAYSVEDLPSDYLGSLLALNPEWTEQRLFLLLGHQRAPVGLGQVRAHVLKIFRKNYEFRPIPYPGAGHVSWPRLLRVVTPASRASGLWESYIYVTPEERTWWQRGTDWVIQAAVSLST